MSQIICLCTCRSNSLWRHHLNCLTQCSSLTFHLPHWKEHFSMFIYSILFSSMFTQLTLYYDYSGARKKVKRVKRAFSSRQARRAQNLSSMRYVCIQVQLSAECLHVTWRQLQWHWLFMFVYSVHQNLDGIGEENEPMDTEVHDIVLYCSWAVFVVFIRII